MESCIDVDGWVWSAVGEDSVAGGHCSEPVTGDYPKVLGSFASDLLPSDAAATDPVALNSD